MNEIEKIERQGMGYKDFPKLDITDEDMISDFEEQHKRHKLIVKEVIEGWDMASNNDFLLYIEVLRALGLLEATSGKINFVFKIKREDLKKIPSPESITRARRSLNEKNLCMPTDPRVIERRRKREKAVRDYFHLRKSLKKNV